MRIGLLYHVIVISCFWLRLYHSVFYLCALNKKNPPKKTYLLDRSCYKTNDNPHSHLNSHSPILLATKQNDLSFVFI